MWIIVQGFVMPLQLQPLRVCGSGAVSAPFTATEDADCAIIIGARPTTNHPVAATYMKQAIKKGTKVIIMDPRKNE